ncbi:chemotaxis protein CheW [Roseobacter sp. GAI101]|uniref:chemotaxis protein CheW n=1 Tax=Roseobacter sp. (strain GAI101) TaxID=391589 RepID=UPI00018720EF|nr:chemotaxis protein CheW [Roseobacter sp. GAI101]EEB86222.1 chemotaxis protein, CheW3 [Roseobacter sp. GAI101]
MTKVTQILTLGCGDDLYAVPVDRVQEILDPCPVSRLPHAPAHLLGVIDVRGDDVVLADLRIILGLPLCADTAATRIVVLWLNWEGRRAVIAVKADRVIEVTHLDDDTLTDVPEAGLFAWEERLVSGIGRCKGKFVTMIDLDSMFQAVSAETLSKAVSTSSKNEQAA